MSLLQLDHSARSLQAHQIFEAAKQPLRPKRDILCTFHDGMEEYNAMSDMLTLIMCRNIRKSVVIATAMMLRIAQQFPERSVLLINTYAGGDLLVESFARAMKFWGFKLPPQFKGIIPEAK